MSSSIITTLFILRLILVIQCNSVSWHYSTIRYSSDFRPTKWDKQHIPNPRKDVGKCGRNGKKSWVCDPSRILSIEEGNRIDEAIEALRHVDAGICHCYDHNNCRRHPDILGFTKKNSSFANLGIDNVYGGWQAAVAILHQIQINSNFLDSDKIETEEYKYVKYVRQNNWSFGVCDDDLLLLVVLDQDLVKVNIGEALHNWLSPACADDILSENQHHFKSGDIVGGVWSIMSSFKAVLQGTKTCKSSFRYSSVITGIGFTISIAIGFFFVRRWAMNKPCVRRNHLIVCLLHLPPNDQNQHRSQTEAEVVAKAENRDVTELTSHLANQNVVVNCPITQPTDKSIHTIV